MGDSDYYENANINDSASAGYKDGPLDLGLGDTFNLNQGFYLGQEGVYDFWNLL